MVEDEVFRVDIFYTQAGASEMMNVFHGRAAETASDASYATAIEDWVTTNWYTIWTDMAYEGAEIVRAKAVVLEPDSFVTARALFDNGQTGLVGAIVGQPNAAAVSAGLTLPTLRPGSRGRKFVPGLPLAEIDDGIISPAMVAVMGDLVLELITVQDFGAAVWRWGIQSTIDFAWLNFVSGIIDDIPDYQRRRRPDVGS